MLLEAPIQTVTVGGNRSWRCSRKWSRAKQQFTRSLRF